MAVLPRHPARGWRDWRSHWLFALLFTGGAMLRALTLLAYRPALEFSQDSFSYLDDAKRLSVDLVRPIGYPIFLRLMSYSGHFVAVAVVQHGLGLATGVILYVLLRRLGVRPWLAALATAPILLDAYQVYLENFVLAEAVFEFLLVTGLFVLLRRERPGVLACLASGLLLAAACLTRTTGIFVLIPVIGYLVVRRVGVAPLAGAVGGAALLLGGYVLWFHANTGHYGVEQYDGFFLAGRVEPFADCRGLNLPPLEQQLCDSAPPSQRQSTDWYIWNPQAPLRRLDPPPGTDRNALAGDFAARILIHQPGAYFEQTAHDVLHYFAPGHSGGHQDFPVQSWQYLTDFTPDPWTPVVPPDNFYVGEWTNPGPHTQFQVKVANQGFGNTEVTPHFRPRLARGLRTYQVLGYTQGPVLAGCLLLALVAACGRLEAADRHSRAVALLLASAGLFVLLAPAMTAVFDYRYQLPTLLLLPPAAALGITLIEHRLRGRRSRAPTSAGVRSLARYTDARQSGLAQR
ncbi:MAG: hypothetical protein NVSMB29_14990 [Candidatus Dormibacteria bacterium]